MPVWANRKTHGMSQNCPEYGIWKTMKRRCSNPNDRRFKDYGGRGITVCDRWKKDFMAFYTDMGPRPSPEASVERVDNNKGYGPENCKWGTDLEQGMNKRNVLILVVGEKRNSVRGWSKELGTTANTLMVYIKQYGVEQGMEMIKKGKPRRGRVKNIESSVNS
jgi:hypothetical protein